MGSPAHSCPFPEEREPQGTALVSVTLGSRCSSPTSLFSTRCGAFVTPGSPCRAPLQGAQDLWFLLNLKVWDTAIPGDAQVLGQALFPTASPGRSGGALELSVPPGALTQLWDTGQPQNGAGHPKLHPGPHTRIPEFVLLPFPKSSFLTASQSTRNRLPRHLWFPFPCRELLTHPCLNASFVDSQSSDS